MTALERIDRNVPVILLSDGAAWSELAIFDTANTIGADAVLQRPALRGALTRLVADLLSQPKGAAGVGDHAELSMLTERVVSLRNPNLL